MYLEWKELQDKANDWQELGPHTNTSLYRKYDTVFCIFYFWLLKSSQLWLSYNLICSIIDWFIFANKTTPIHRWHDNLYRKSLGIYKKALRTNKSSKVVGYKVTEKSITFLLINFEKLENKILKVQLAIVLKN